MEDIDWFSLYNLRSGCYANKCILYLKKKPFLALLL